ncbi:MAG: PAS domain S-box protein, partial [Cycloclasticus sp.]|nr:PAS domain S-box protein [Cycloclasticus sp.]
MTMHLPKLLLLVAVTSLIMLTATFYSLNTGRDIATRYTPLVNAAMEIKLEATTAHLWFEEAISGDRTIAIDSIWKHLDQSEWYAHAMLNGGTNEKGIFIPLNDPVLRRQVEQTINGLRLFRQTAHQRWNEQSTSGIGSDIDQQFDKAFSRFTLSADSVETALQKIIAEDIQYFEFVEKLLILIIVIFALSVGVLLFFYDRMQTKTLQILHDKEESLRITLNSIADAVIVTDTHGLITYMNPVAVGLTGWSAEQAVEQPILDVFNIIHASTRAPVQNPVEKVLKTKTIVTLANHTVLIAKDGSEYQISDSAAPIFAADGSIDGVVLIFRDVSEEYALHESIKKSEVLIGTLINSLPDFIWLKGIDGTYISCNAKVEGFFKAQKINIIGKTDHDFLDKKLADSFREHDLTVLRTNQALTTEEQVTYTTGGPTETVEVTRSPMISADGELIGVLGIAHDITNRKKAEEKLKAAEERWNFVLEGTKDGVWDWNVETDEVYYSKELKAIWGYDETDITPSLTAWKARIHPDDEEKVWQKLDKHFHHETTHYESEQRILRKDGAYKWVLARGKVVAWTKDGKPLRMIGTHIDISERKQAEERYRHIFHNSLTEIFIFDAETYQFLNVNRGATNNIGYTEKELLKLTPVDITPEVSLKQFNDLVKPLREGTEKIIHSESVHQRKNGQLYPVEVHLQLTNDTLKPAFIAIVMDISERKAAMDKLQLSSRVFSDTHEAIAITDVNSLIIDVNPAFYEITGYSREEALGQNPSFLSSGKQSPEFYQAMWEQINEQGHWQGEIWNRTKNGEFYAELLSISVLKDT